MRSQLTAARVSISVYNSYVLKAVPSS